MNPQSLEFITNPNTPQEILWKLAAQENLPPEVREELLKKNDWIINKLLNPEENNTTTDEVGWEEFKNYAYGNPLLEIEIKDKFECFIKNPKSMIKVAENEYTSNVTKMMILRNIFRLPFANQNYVGLCLIKSQSPQTLDKESQMTLANLGEIVKRELASCAGLKEEIQIKLAADEDEVTRIKLAQSEYICEPAQHLLAKDNYYLVRKNLALNKNITYLTQKILTEDEDHTVRDSLLKNPSVSQKIKEKLSPF